MWKTIFHLVAPFERKMSSCRPGKLEKSMELLNADSRPWKSMDFENVGAVREKWPMNTSMINHVICGFQSLPVIFEDSKIPWNGLENGRDWPRKSMEKAWICRPERSVIPVGQTYVTDHLFQINACFLRPLAVYKRVLYKEGCPVHLILLNN